MKIELEKKAEEVNRILSQLVKKQQNISIEQVDLILSNEENNDIQNEDEENEG